MKAHPLASRCDASPSDGLGDRLRPDDVHGLAAALGAELDRTRDEREQRVVAATADAVAGVEVGAALADDDLAGVDDLAAEALDAEALALESRPLRVEDAPFLCAMSVPTLVSRGCQIEDCGCEAQASIAVTLTWVEC